jgi:hypothetical protein
LPSNIALPTGTGITCGCDEVRLEPDGESGTPEIVGVLTDVTARKHIEQSLENQRRVLEMVVSGAPLPATLNTRVQGVEALCRTCGRRSCCSTGTAVCATAQPEPARELHPRHRRRGHRGGRRLLRHCGVARCAGGCRRHLHRSAVGAVPEAEANGLVACWSSPILSRRAACSALSPCIR